MASVTLGNVAIIHRGDYAADAVYRNAHTVVFEGDTYICISRTGISGIAPKADGVLRADYWRLAIDLSGVRAMEAGYTAAEAARNTAYGEAEGARNASFAEAEETRHTTFTEAEETREASVAAVVDGANTAIEGANTAAGAANTAAAAANAAAAVMVANLGGLSFAVGEDGGLDITYTY